MGGVEGFEKLVLCNVARKKGHGKLGVVFDDTYTLILHVNIAIHVAMATARMFWGTKDQGFLKKW